MIRTTTDTAEGQRCLYCRERGRASKKPEHFLPERFGEGHPFWLEPGVVCDDCNNYASHDLDPSLWESDSRSMFWLWRARVPGKGGKRGKLQGPGFVLEPSTGAARFDRGLGRRVDRERIERFFARALYKVALGLLALRRGPAYATHPRFDDVARYVKTARPREFWPYARAQGRWIRDDVQLALELLERDDTLVAELQLATVTYWAVLSGDPAVLETIAAAVPFGRVIRKTPDTVGDEPWSTLSFQLPGPIVEVREGVLMANGKFEPTFFDPAKPAVQVLRLDVPLWDAQLNR